MKKTIFTLCAFLLAVATQAEITSTITYKGQSLVEDNSFTRTQSGTTNKNDVKEVSGIACSRVTAGYLWVEIDEGTSSIWALNASTGAKQMTLNLSGVGSRDDWEDLAAGVVNDTNFLFLGAFGDNDLVYKDNYQIHCFPEPSITSGTKSATVTTIKFGFPDGKAHNVETLMFDNVEQVFYIVDKVKSGLCTLYSLPFNRNSTGIQRLTQVTTLGNSGETSFDFCTSGDISPDGHWVLIKNKKHVLMWERQGTESLSVTLKRQPVYVNAYQEEEQGEAIAWLDNTTFYTTSDSKKNTPIYKYVRTLPTPTTLEEMVLEEKKKEEVDWGNNVEIYDLRGVLIYDGMAKNLQLDTPYVIVRQNGRGRLMSTASLCK